MRETGPNLEQQMLTIGEREDGFIGPSWEQGGLIEGAALWPGELPCMHVLPPHK